MVICIFGESCSGKTTLANAIKEKIGADIYSGKDYLRFAKNEYDAKRLFAKRLEEASNNENIIYVISEKEHLSFIPNGATKILVTASLEKIKDRFRKRMNGHLPVPVEKMIERKHGCFNNELFDIHYISDNMDVNEIVKHFD